MGASVGYSGRRALVIALGFVTVAFSALQFADTAGGAELSRNERGRVEAMCLVDSAELGWGSDGTILNDPPTSAYTRTKAGLDNVIDNGGTLVWLDGTGAIDPATGAGTVGFTGTVDFAERDGALDASISNPRVEFSDEGTFLVVDVTRVDQDGSEVNAPGVRLASLYREGESGGGNTVRLKMAAVLSDAGSAALGMNSESEELAPISLKATGVDDCLLTWAGVAPVETPTAYPSATPAPTAYEPYDEDYTGPDDYRPLILAFLVVVALGIAGIIGIIVACTRSGHRQP